MHETTAEAALRDKVAKFAHDITSAADSREGVSVAVIRREGFQNQALTPRGLSVLLDEPVHFGGRGEAPDPAEYLLAAVGASLSVTLTAHAAIRGLRIDHIEVGLSAEIDGLPFFHPGSGGKAGLLDMSLTLTVRTPLKRADFRALLRDVLRATPVLRSLKRLPRIHVRYEE